MLKNNPFPQALLLRHPPIPHLEPGWTLVLTLECSRCLHTGLHPFREGCVGLLTALGVLFCNWNQAGDWDTDAISPWRDGVTLGAGMGPAAVG